MTCDGCAFHTEDPATDTERDTQYFHRCWRECGAPQLRRCTNEPDNPPPACCEWYAVTKG